MHRLFVAVDLPEEVCGALLALRHGVPGARWLGRDQIHLTLRFIGEVDGGLFEDIVVALAEVRGEPFEIALKGVGHFPPSGPPRVLWVGIEKNEALLKLQSRIESALGCAGLAPEGRKFHPHVTLARLKEPRLARVARFLAANALFHRGPVPVREFHLYSSRLGAKNAIYRIEASYPLIGREGPRRAASGR